jgi:hypothetical protein
MSYSCTFLAWGFWRNPWRSKGGVSQARGKSRLECRNVSSSHNFDESLEQCRGVSRTGDVGDGGRLKVSCRPPVHRKASASFQR